MVEEPREIDVGQRARIPVEELELTAVRSGGPGGQHVNKVATRVVLRFDVEASPSLSEAMRARLRERLATRIGKDGALRLSCGAHRSKAANRREVLDRFEALVREALKPRKRRRSTRVPNAEKRRRLESKKKRAEVKRARGRVDPGRE